jgi:hypothetical protein
MEMEEQNARERARRFERRKREWRADFPGWLNWICSYWDGMNPKLSEREQLEALLDEIEYMASAMRARLQDLPNAGEENSHGCNQ